MTLAQPYGSSSLFRHFLALLKDGEVSALDTSYEVTFKLARFLLDWDFKLPLRFLVMQLRAKLDIQNIRIPHLLFWCAAAADDFETCHYVLAREYQTVWSTPVDKATEWEVHPGAHIWDANGWGSWLGDNQPKEYAWALGKAYCEVGATSALAEKFLEHLKICKEKAEEVGCSDEQG